MCKKKKEEKKKKEKKKKRKKKKKGELPSFFPCGLKCLSQVSRHQK